MTQKTTDQQSIVIVGSGLAAYTFAITWRRLIAASADQEAPALTLLTAAGGEFYPKPMLSTALTHQKMPADLVTNSAQAMADQLNATVRTDVQVTSIDANKQLVWLQDHQQPVSYTQLILACGAKPFPLLYTVEPSDAVSDIYRVNNLEDYRYFRDRLAGKQRLAIIGAGLVGCEFANDLVNAGFHVDVVAMGDQLLEGLLPAALAQAVQHQLAEKGVTWHLNQQVDLIKHLPTGGYRLQLSGGETIEADGVLSAIGLTPNIDLAKSAGLKIGRGIIVDRHLSTSDPAIYALGDCAEVNGMLMYFIAPLRQCAQALAKTLSGTKTAVSYPPMPVMVKTPSCPTVVSPPPPACKGSWQVQGEDHHLTALFHDNSGNLRGFALTGDRVKERAKWAKQLPVMF